MRETANSRGKIAKPSYLFVYNGHARASGLQLPVATEEAEGGKRGSSSLRLTPAKKKQMMEALDIKSESAALSGEESIILATAEKLEPGVYMRVAGNQVQELEYLLGELEPF